jgi:hypothetical protein
MLTVADADRLIGICVDLIRLASRVTGKIDPAVHTLITIARKDLVARAAKSEP